MVTSPAESSTNNLALTPYENQDKSSLIDSLPYVDYIHEDYEAYALHLIEDEMKNIPAPTEPIMDEPSFLKNEDSSLMKQYYNEIASRAAASDGDTSSSSTTATTFAVTAPLVTEPLRGSPLENDEHAWRDSVRRARCEYERQIQKQSILELRQAFETGQWKMYNEALDDMARIMEESVVALQRRKVDEINARRTMMQEGARGRLEELAARYEDLIVKNKRLSRGVGVLEREVERMRVEHGISADALAGVDQKEEE